MTSNVTHHPSSYRDPSGFIFEKEGTLYRQVNFSFKDHFDHFIQSGCYSHLSGKGLLIPHEQINQPFSNDNSWYTTLKPEKIPFISYPYEWSFDMLKDAALLTLQLAREALDFNMVLKDATPYNIQWYKGKLIFIDSLSFEKYDNTPWIAYRQFCENFLGPLLIMKYNKMPMPGLLLAWPDGIPLNVISSLLPGKSKFNVHTYLHIHLHSRIAAKNQTTATASPGFSKQKLLRLISSLETLVNSLKLPEKQSTWSAYYDEAAQRDDYLEQKKKIISGWLDNMHDIKKAADLGSNDGEFSRLLAAKNTEILAADFDPYCINNLYKAIKITGTKNIQPLILDISNPSPSTGVNNQERASFIERINVDLTLALALIHHLAIGKNIPFSMIAGFFHQITTRLIIEFVPVQDEKVQLMLAQKPGIGRDYDQGNFELSFTQYFDIEKKEAIGSSGRTLYLMTGKQSRQ